MQIVIDIPDKDYNKIMNNKFYGIDGCLDSLVYRLVGNVYEGTPLPKGHGRLIDADKLIGEFENVCAGECGCCGRVNNCPVFTQQTIIEADKAGDEE